MRLSVLVMLELHAPFEDVAFAQSMAKGVPVVL